MTDTSLPQTLGWYRTPDNASTVDFWTGEGWAGTPKPAAGRTIARPRDTLGIIALLLLAVAALTQLGGLFILGCAVGVAGFIVGLVGLTSDSARRRNRPQSVIAVLIGGPAILFSLLLVPVILAVGAGIAALITLI